MRYPTKILIQCDLTATPFSGERFYSLTLADGNRHEGTVPVRHCYDENQKRLQAEDQAPHKGFMEGLAVDTRTSQEGKSYLIMAAPDGSTFALWPNQVTALPAMKDDVSALIQAG